MQQLSERALNTLELLGDFSPVNDPSKCTMKGFMFDEIGSHKTYLTSDEFREMAEDFIEIAIWLEQRANRT